MHENLGPLPIGPHDHPDPHAMVWSELELRAIRAYAERCMAAQREQIARWLEGQGQPGYAHEVRHGAGA